LKGCRFSVAVCAQVYLSAGDRQRTRNELFIPNSHDSIRLYVHHSVSLGSFAPRYGPEKVRPLQDHGLPRELVQDKVKIKQIPSVKMRHDLLPLIGSLRTYFIGSRGTDKGGCRPGQKPRFRNSSGYICGR
jgi:hypothetical protein